MNELLERLNPHRRERTYPRVQKRGNRHKFATKEHRHEQRPYDPKIMLLAAQPA